MCARLVGVRGAGLGTPGGVVMGCRPEIQHLLQDSAPLFALFHVLYGRPNLSTQPLLLHSCCIHGVAEGAQGVWRLASWALFPLLKGLRPGGIAQTASNPGLHPPPFLAMVQNSG